MRVHEVMTVPPARIRHDSNLHHAAQIVALSGVSDLMVVDGDGSYVGVLSEADILQSTLPNLEETLEAGGTLEDAFEVLLRKGRSLANRPIMSLVIRDPFMVDPDDHVARAATILVDRRIRRLPVVSKEGKLVGTISRADVCRAVVGTL